MIRPPSCRALCLAILVLGTSGITVGTWVWYGSNKDHNRSELRASADQINLRRRLTHDLKISRAPAANMRSPSSLPSAEWRCSNATAGAMKPQPFTSSRHRSAAGVADDRANLPDRLHDPAPPALDSRAAKATSS